MKTKVILCLAIILPLLVTPLAFSGDISESSKASGKSTACDEKGEAVIAAVRKPDRKSFDKLIAEGAPVDCRKLSGRSALFWAVGKKDVEITRILLQKGADPDVKVTSNSITALMMAAHSGNMELVQLLLDAGVDVHFKNIFNAQAIDYAKRRGHDKVARLLRRAMATK